MSYLSIGYKKSLADKFESNHKKLTKGLVELTAKVFGKKPEEIIVVYQEMVKYDGRRDVVIRGETSLKNSDLLETWADGIANVLEVSGFGNSDLAVGIKTYTVDSFWKEVNFIKQT